MIAVGNLSGRVSTEVDARLSFDTEGTIAKVKELAALYEEIGVNWGERVLFKVGCLQNAGEGGGDVPCVSCGLCVHPTQPVASIVISPRWNRSFTF